MPAYFLEQLDATRQTGENARAGRILRLEARAQYDVQMSGCAASYGMEITVKYHFEDLLRTVLTDEPHGTVLGTACIDIDTPKPKSRHLKERWRQ
jgi:hypothetical protein